MNRVEVFSAGCPCCDKAVALVKDVCQASDEVEVVSMNEPRGVARAEHYGVKRVPAIFVNGNLAGCCAGGAPDEATLRSTLAESA
jgi:glutaredoxin 3